MQKLDFDPGTIFHASYLVDQITGVMRQNNIALILVAYNKKFRASLFLLNSGEWRVQSPYDDYVIRIDQSRPILIEVLVKFIKFEDPDNDFEDVCGTRELYQLYEHYDARCRTYIESKRPKFLQLFIERLILIRTSGKYEPPR